MSPASSDDQGHPLCLFKYTGHYSASSTPYSQAAGIPREEGAGAPAQSFSNLPPVT